MSLVLGESFKVNTPLLLRSAELPDSIFDTQCPHSLTLLLVFSLELSARFTRSLFPKIEPLLVPAFQPSLARSQAIARFARFARSQAPAWERE
jgi:hypothetical protein